MDFVTLINIDDTQYIYCECVCAVCLNNDKDNITSA